MLARFSKRRAMDLEKLVGKFKAAVRRADPRGAGRRYPPAARPPRFVPVSVVADVTTPAQIVVHGPGGVRIEGLDLGAVAELLRRLA